MNKKDVKSAVEKGQIHCRIMLQVAGTPKEHVEEALKGYVTNIGSNEAFAVIDAEYSPAEKEDQFFSAFVDVEMLVTNTHALTELCFNYMPSNIEFISPKEILFKKKDIDNWFNDLLAKLHEITMLSKEVGAQNRTVVNNMRALMQNAILMAVNHGKNVSEIADSLGMKVQDIEPFIKAMIKEKKIVIKDNKIERVKKKK